MKVAIGQMRRDGAWGGGNRFVGALTGALKEAGHEVVHRLADNDIDIVLMIDPRWRNPSVTFTPGKILRYLWRRNPRAIVVHRVNECDERKGTRHMNALLARANYCADHTVFVGSWLLDLPPWRGKERDASSVILNGSDTAVFHPRGQRRWNGRDPLRLVTHHWGGNRMKGFDVYEEIDRMLADPVWRDRLAFTYVGNLPSGFRFKHARYLEPLDGRALVDELHTHHVYLTASINEPGGHHQNEGALCGLPLLYRDSGCLPEYCEGFGVMFTPETFEPALETMIERYDDLLTVMPGYGHTAERCCGRYLALFEDLLARRDAIVSRRRLWRSPGLFLRNQLAI